MGAHARNSPSALYRTLNCPPSLVLGEQFQDEESQYAAEGSAGHALAEHLIKKHLHLRTKRPVSDYYSDDLIEAVEDYVAFVIEKIEEAKRECRTPLFSVEQRVDISEYSPDCFGTADMVIVTDKVAHVIDLKLGRGVEVSAEENPQLMAYGLGVLEMVEKFCSDECRRHWWSAHQDELKKKPTALYEKECAYCHKPFVAYGNKNRKYCSHECYVRDRFFREEKGREPHIGPAASEEEKE